MTLAVMLMLATATYSYSQVGGAKNETSASAGTESGSQKGPANAQAESYEASREHLQRARESLRQAKDEAEQGLQKQLQRAQEQLDALSKRLEEAATSAKTTALATARKMEQEISLRARRMEARALLLAARAKTSLAVREAAKNNFARADKNLADATDLLRRARAALVDDHTYDYELDDMKVALADATKAIKAHAEDARQKIEKAATQAELLVSSLEVNEQKAYIEGR